MISVILVEPQTPGNIGAVARIMKNFGISSLYLVNPKCDHLSDDALFRATHAKDILKKAKVVKKIPKCDILAATTARLGEDDNIARSPISPKVFASMIADKKGKIGIVFGREADGLTTNEIKLCDLTLSISASSYNVLNISHAAAIVLYEVFNYKAKPIHPLATGAEKKVLFELIHQSIKKLSFSTDEKKLTQIKVWKRVIGKSMVTKREIQSLLGYFRKLK